MVRNPFQELKMITPPCRAPRGIAQAPRTAACQPSNPDISTEPVSDWYCNFSDGNGNGFSMEPDDHAQQESSVYQASGSGSSDFITLGEPTSRELPPPERSSSGDTIVSRLYPNYKLGCLLKYCFDELEFYYPCIDRIDFYDRLSVLFVDYCSCKNGSTLIPKEPEHLALAALACQMLAIATYIGGDLKPNQPQVVDDPYAEASWKWYLEGRRLLAQSLWQDKPNLDILRLHVLEVVYDAMLEKPKAMSNVVAVVVDLAFVLELHNEELWGACTPREKEYRRLLWWTVYVLDRRIAFRIGRPYLIRDSEWAVAEFTTLSWECYFLHTASETETSGIPLHWPHPSTVTENWFKYLQFNIQWSKIATKAWDDFCSLHRPKSTGLNTIDVTDALIINLRINLPLSLQWDPNGLPSLVEPGEMDRSLRLRLIVFEVCIYCITAPS
jgi:hypothetical protein